MKVVVLGAGALGSILAGHLARAGEDVTLIARGDRAGYLRDNGITITGVAEFNTPCPITSDPSELRDTDVLIVTVKTHDMEAAISSLAHVRFSSVISVQNGVHLNEQLAGFFGAACTVGSSAYFSGEMSPNGDVRFTVNDGFFIGELPEGVSDRVQDLSAMLQNTGIKSEPVANIQTFQWSKFAAWGAAAPVSILTRLATYRFLLDRDSALIFARIAREIAGIADKMGITVENSGLFPVKAWVSGSEEEAVSMLQELGAYLEANAPEHRVSILQDLERGRRLEIDETLGYAVAEARRLGIPAPTLETCYGLLRGINRNL
ncbi:MAG: ketopantoate reductase family protein [Chloroflexi bacterium]|nr:ketopantoate reductase family protein [Chloroflexota bacterium]